MTPPELTPVLLVEPEQKPDMKLYAMPDGGVAAHWSGTIKEARIANIRMYDGLMRSL